MSSLLQPRSHSRRKHSSTTTMKCQRLLLPLAVLLCALAVTVVSAHIGDASAQRMQRRRHHALSAAAVAPAEAEPASFSWYQPEPSAAAGASEATAPTLLTARQASGGGNPGASPVTGNSTNLGPGECTAQVPCENGACCDGQYCGYGPDYCTTVANGGKCLSNCNAVAECGQYAATPGLQCPLNVCCSQYGFCGTTDEFCGTGCQSNCGYPAGESCDPSQSTSTQRRVGYYQSWATDPSSRACMVFPPSMIPAEALTHLNWAFVAFDSSYNIVNPGELGLEFLQENQAMKARNPGLKVIMSIGGWSFNDPPTQALFSNLANSQANINTFAKSVQFFMQYWGFDGVDIDWEYPVAPERGGQPGDYAGIVNLMATLRQVLGSGAVVTMTLPSSYWYLRHFNLPSLVNSVDFFNLMTYDLHGVWDATDPYIGSYVLAHTNLTEIKQTLQLFDRVNIPHNKIALGYGFYGRSFTLSDPSCTTPGCPFSGGANPGPCSLNSGTLMFSEIEEIISADSVQPILDSDAAVMYMTWNDNQWVSYDNADTFQMKQDWANSNCLGGSMIWSVDQDDSQYTALRGLFPDLNIAAGVTTNEPNSWIFSTANIAGATTEDEQDDENAEDEWTTDPPPQYSSTDNLGGSQAFGEVFISSPQASSVSSMDFVSDWVITNCTRNSKEPQTVVAYCRKHKSDQDRGCDHLFHGQVEHTIVKMPKTCGKSPYAHISSFAPAHATHLPSYHRSRLPEGETPYVMRFDYEYAAIPESNGPVYMRADLSNDRDYMAKIVEEAPGSAFRQRNIRARRKARYGTRHHKRRFHDDPTHVLHPRWWGAFTDWLSRLNRVESESVTSQRVYLSEYFVLYEASEQCSSSYGSASSSLSVTANTGFVADTQYGYYLQATVVPPAVLQSYAYFSANPTVSIDFEVAGQAQVTFDSTRVTLLSQGFPGLSYPGLLEVGPAISIVGYATGSFAAQGYFRSSYQWNVPEVYFAIGRASSSDSTGTTSDTSGPISATANARGQPGYSTPTSSLGAQFNADVQVHVVPSLSMGISILNGAVIDGGVYVEADVYGGFEASVAAGSTQLTSACLQSTYGMDVGMGYYGTLLSQSSGSSTSLYSSSATYPWAGGNCMPWQAGSKRSLGDNETEIHIEPSFNNFEKRNPPSDNSYLPGSIVCPSGSTGIGSCDPFSDGDYSSLSRRDLAEERDDIDSDVFLSLEPRQAAGGVSVPKLAYQNVPYYEYCDLAAPASMSGAATCSSNSPLMANNYAGGLNVQQASGSNAVSVYQREHVYETSTISAFLNSLNSNSYSQGQLYGSGWADFMDALNTPQPVPGGGNQQSIIYQLANCLPSNAQPTTDVFGQQKFMPVLASIINYEKQLAFNGKGGSTSVTCANGLIGTARGSAAVLGYMNRQEVQLEYIRASNCIKQSLQAWFPHYAAEASPAPSMSAASFAGAYSSWIQGRVNGLQGAIQNRIQVLSNKFGSSSRAVTLSFQPAWLSNVDPTVAASVQPRTNNYQASSSDFQSLINNLPGIGWAGQL